MTTTIHFNAERGPLAVDETLDVIAESLQGGGWTTVTKVGSANRCFVNAANVAYLEELPVSDPEPEELALPAENAPKQRTIMSGVLDEKF